MPIRKDILVVAVVFIILGIGLYFTPARTPTVLTNASFAPADRPGWYSAGEIYVPPGDGLDISYSSNVPILLGFSNASSWVGFNNGSVPEPKLYAESSGLYGHLSFSSANGVYVFLVGNWSQSSSPVLEMTLTGINVHAFFPYALLSFLIGAIFLCLSLTYMRLRSFFRRKRI
ncbi:MAG: hypothetical protein QXP70_05160 [Methanomassiliicoccales archaeon]